MIGSGTQWHVLNLKTQLIPRAASLSQAGPGLADSDCSRRASLRVSSL